MDVHRPRRSILMIAATALFVSGAGAAPFHPTDRPVAPQVPVRVVQVYQPLPCLGPCRPLPPCFGGSRWYGPYGYICYRTAGPQFLGAYAVPR